jgi:hypothetical protein
MLVFATSHKLKYETKEAICLAGEGNPYRAGAELDKRWPSIFKLLSVNTMQVPQSIISTRVSSNPSKLRQHFIHNKRPMIINLLFLEEVNTGSVALQELWSA